MDERLKDEWLMFHLEHNCCPPIPHQFDVAKLSIEKANAGQEDSIVASNEDGDEVSAWEVIENLHLNDFLELPYEWLEIGDYVVKGYPVGVAEKKPRRLFRIGGRGWKEKE